MPYKVELKNKIQCLAPRQMASKVKTTAATIASAATSPGIWFIPKSTESRKNHHYQFFEFAYGKRCLPRVISCLDSNYMFHIIGDVV